MVDFYIMKNNICSSGMRLKGAWWLRDMAHETEVVCLVLVCLVLGIFWFFLWAISSIVAIPTGVSLTTLLNFKVSINDGIGEQVQTDNSRDKHLSTSGIWPFIEYIQYRKLVCFK